MTMLATCHAGKYSGVQARVLEENNKASYIPCMAHSLNLSGVSAAESCVNAVSFFGFVEKLLRFFLPQHIVGIF